MSNQSLAFTIDKLNRIVIEKGASHLLEDKEMCSAIALKLNVEKDVDINENKRNMNAFFLNESLSLSQGIKTFNGYKPRTMIFLSNYCELELMRGMFLFDPYNYKLISSIDKTIERIKTTCFGRFCPTGECINISMVCLRFISSVAFNEKKWINMYIEEIAKEIKANPKRITLREKIYYFNILYEINNDKSKELLCDFHDELFVAEKRYVKQVTHYDKLNAIIAKRCMGFIRDDIVV